MVLLDGEAKPLPPLNADIKNTWNCISTHHMASWCSAQVQLYRLSKVNFCFKN